MDYAPGAGEVEPTATVTRRDRPGRDSRDDPVKKVLIEVSPGGRGTMGVPGHTDLRPFPVGASKDRGAREELPGVYRVLVVNGGGGENGVGLTFHYPYDPRRGTLTRLRVIHQVPGNLRTFED